MKKKYMYTVNNYQLGALVKSTPVDRIIKQDRIDRNHTEITYSFETERQREFTEQVLNKRGIFKGFER